MEQLRHIPAIHTLQKQDKFSYIEETHSLPRAKLTAWLGEIVDLMRKQILAKDITLDLADESLLLEYIFEKLTKKVDDHLQSNKLQRVINATGVVLHTNLGRARLSEQAIKQISETAENYSTLEYNVKTGKRGSRHDIIENYLTELTGAEAAIIVNNNAAAVFLVLKALAENKEVIVSRGELVEIGGSFRISEIMAESNARLVEVGTTNKTNVADYERAINEETGLILKVHKSNFALIGFTAETDTDALVKLANKFDIPLYDDLGSGTLYDFKQEQIGFEPTVKEKINSGIDLVSFSGDKLLGGPQAGIIVGKKVFIDQLKQHQLARVLRVDKFTLAGLEATLKAYEMGTEKEIPTIRDIITSEETIKNRAQQFLQNIHDLNSDFHFSMERDLSRVGGGTMPTVELKTYVIQVKHKQLSSEKIAEKLRHNKIPIIVRVKNEMIQLDFRTIDEKEMAELTEAFLQIGERN